MFFSSFPALCRRIFRSFISSPRSRLCFNLNLSSNPFHLRTRWTANFCLRCFGKNHIATTKPLPKCTDSGLCLGSHRVPSDGEGAPRSRARAVQPSTGSTSPAAVPLRTSLPQLHRVTPPQSRHRRRQRRHPLPRGRRQRRGGVRSRRRQKEAGGAGGVTGGTVRVTPAARVWWGHVVPRSMGRC